MLGVGGGIRGALLDVCGAGDGQGAIEPLRLSQTSSRELLPILLRGKSWPASGGDQRLEVHLRKQKALRLFQIGQ